MPHHPRPFYKQKRNLWYVEIDREQVVLGPHPDGPPPRRKPPQRGRKTGDWDPPPPILAAYHLVMVRPKAEPKPLPSSGDSVVAVCDKFTAWCKEHRKSATFEWYRWRLQLFCDYLKKHKVTDLLVADLKPFHIDEFLAEWPTWSSGMKHGACRAVQRAMRWAEKKGYISRSPIAHYEKPRPGKRKMVLSQQQFDELLSHVPSDDFRDLLTVTWETGCRPQESLAVEARHVDLSNARWVFPPDEAKGEEWPRIVYLTDNALAITRRLMLKHPDGPIFRNDYGSPWVPYAVNCALSRVQVRMGILAMKAKGVPPPSGEGFSKKRKRALLEKAARKHAPKYCLYVIRHSWATRALQRGVDALTVAILLGHRDPSTLSKVYQHLSQDPRYLRDAAKKAAS